VDPPNQRPEGERHTHRNQAGKLSTRLLPVETQTESTNRRFLFLGRKRKEKKTSFAICCDNLYPVAPCLPLTQVRYDQRSVPTSPTQICRKRYRRVCEKVRPSADDHQASGKRCRNVSVALPAMLMQSIVQNMFPGFHLSGHRGMNECLGFGSYISVHSYAQCTSYCAGSSTLGAVETCLFAHSLV